MKSKQSHILFTIFLSMGFATCKKDKDSVPPPPAIAYYKFDGDAKNSISSLYKGQVVGGISSAEDSLGYDHACYYFPGDSHVYIQDADGLDFPGNQFTFSAWIRPGEAKGTYVVHKETGNDDEPYSLDIFPGVVRALVRNTADKEFIATGHTPIVKNVWQHIAVTFSGTKLIVYYNGESEGETTVDGALASSNGPMNIGANQNLLPVASFVGRIDNVGIYDKALSGAQIRNLYRNYNQ